MQRDSRFEIIAPADPSISIASCDPATHPVFRQLFERPRFELFAREAATFSEYSLVLTNQSSERIMALTIIWNYPHPVLKVPSRIISRNSAYYFEGNNAAAIIPPHMQVLISPKRNISAALFEQPGGLVFISSEGRINGLRDIDRLNEAPRVTVTFDSIIFEGGRVLGPDNSRTVDFIKNRKRAATDIVTLVRRAKEDGLAIEAFLQNLDIAERGDPGDQSYDFWLQSFARMLHTGPRAARAVTLMQLADLPEPPDFKK
jgi:hypothetical protein